MRALHKRGLIDQSGPPERPRYGRPFRDFQDRLAPVDYPAPRSVAIPVIHLTSRDVALAIGATCQKQATRMIIEHDRLYGDGTGNSFYRNAYIPDLPRALTARLKPIFERRAAEAQQAEAARQAELTRLEAERSHQIEVAERSLNLLRDKMYDCTRKQLASLVKSAESAEVLAIAALTICQEEVDQTANSYTAFLRIKYPSVAASEISQGWKKAEEVVRKSVVTTAVQIRAALAYAAEEQRQREEAASPGMIPARKMY